MTAFWIAVLGVSAVGLVFPYLGYPLWLLLLRDRAVSDWRRSGEAPAVTVIIAAHNEAANMALKLENLLAQAYPGPMQVIVVSDASEDGTDDIVRSFADRSVELLRLPDRGGKSRAQNAALDMARHDILIFTDASVLLDGGAIEALIDEMADPTVGAAGGEDVSTSGSGGDRSEAAGFYTRFEILVRRLEQRKYGTLIGVSGCLFAVRRWLRPPVAPEAVDDFAVPLHVVTRGYRVVATDKARAFVRRAGGFRQEFRRKVRTFTGAMFTLSHARRNEDRVGLARARQAIVFHKLMRWWGPGFALAALIANGALAVGTLSGTHRLTALGALWLCGLAAQMTFYGFGALGLLRSLRDKPGRALPGPIEKVARLASFFLVVQMAVALAWWRYARGRDYAVWTPTQRVDA